MHRPLMTLNCLNRFTAGCFWQVNAAADLNMFWLTQLLKESSASQVDHLVEIISPALSGILMVTIGLTLISVMMPLVGMMNAIG